MSGDYALCTTSHHLGAPITAKAKKTSARKKQLCVCSTVIYPLAMCLIQINVIWLVIYVVHTLRQIVTKFCSPSSYSLGDIAAHTDKKGIFTVHLKLFRNIYSKHALCDQRSLFALYLLRNGYKY